MTYYLWMHHWHLFCFPHQRFQFETYPEPMNSFLKCHGEKISIESNSLDRPIVPKFYSLGVGNIFCCGCQVKNNVFQTVYPIFILYILDIYLVILLYNCTAGSYGLLNFILLNWLNEFQIKLANNFVKHACQQNTKT